MFYGAPVPIDANGRMEGIGEAEIGERDVADEVHHVCAADRSDLNVVGEGAAIPTEGQA